MLMLTSGSTFGITGVPISGAVGDFVEGVEVSVLPPSLHPTPLQEIRQFLAVGESSIGDTFGSCSLGEPLMST